MKQFGIVGLGLLSSLLLLSPLAAQAGHFHRRHHSHHHHGHVGDIAFAVGAVATLLSPPRPPVIIHQHDYVPYYPPIRYGTPVPYHYVPSTTMYRQAQSYHVPNTAPQPVITNVPVTPSPKQWAVPGQSKFPERSPAVGTVVDRLPTRAAKVERNGVIYFEEDRVWYLPIKINNEGKYVVVSPQ